MAGRIPDAVPLVIALQVAAVYWEPLSTVLRTVPLVPSDWLLVFGLAAVPALVGQTVHLVRAHSAAQVAPNMSRILDRLGVLQHVAREGVALEGVSVRRTSCRAASRHA